MVKKTSGAIASGRDLIIRRPRLTRLLDETQSRTILLLAPAGYGKTTLAREWLEDRPYVWYGGSSASADVAALAQGIAASLTTLVPGAADHVRERLEATEAPARDVPALADVLLRDLSAFPPDALIAFDDYQFTTLTPEAEELVELIVTRSTVNFLVASRRRPRWVTARSRLYGEVFEIGRSSLAMTQNEAEQILSDRSSDEVPGLLAIAEGWPAVLGLAARARELEVPKLTEASALFDFFADELLQDLSSDMQEAMIRLAIAPVITPTVVSLLYGAAGSEVIDEAVRRGILMPHATDSLDLHPLLRDFLERKLMGLGLGLATSLSDVVDLLISEGKWDEAFALIERFTLPDLVAQLVEAAMAPLLAGGRLSTLNRWLRFAAAAGDRSPVLDLAEAEIAFREGLHSKAQALALEAVRQLGSSHLASRALALAGECAYQLDHSRQSLDLHGRAAQQARTVADRRRAIWGQFLAAIQLEDPSAGELLNSIEESHGTTVEGTLRLATGRLLLSATNDYVEEVVDETRPVVHLVERCSDAKIRTSFLSLFANALAVTANYAEAREVVCRAKRDADARRLTFTLPFTLLVECTAALGLRDFVEAANQLDQCLALAARQGDVFLDMSARVARAKLMLATGAHRDAVKAITENWTHVPGPVVLGEFLGVRALALACVDEVDLALSLAQRAESATNGVEARTFAACTRAVVACRAQRGATRAVHIAFATATTTQNFDALVAALRAEPMVAAEAAESESCQVLLVRLLERSNDYDLARSIGLALPRSSVGGSPTLTPREREVFALMCQGLSNRGIASNLFLSEATVKVHVRKILKKFGVRSRTQAVLLRAPSQDRADGIS